MTDKIKVGDKLTIAGVNISKEGKIFFNKKRKKARRTPRPVFIVKEIYENL
jgi:hypothetical protein